MLPALAGGRKFLSGTGCKPVSVHSGVDCRVHTNKLIGAFASGFAWMEERRKEKCMNFSCVRVLLFVLCTGVIP